MRQVDFFLIGAQKAGTTSLYRYLDQHPDIFMPKAKENHFFAEDRFYEKGVEYFHKFYDDYADQKLIGGAYVHLLSSKEAPQRIYGYNKNAKILIMLRNPVDRAYSAYHFALKNGWESKENGFINTMELQQKRLSGNFMERTDLSYFEVGLYFKHISNWLTWFPKKQVFILLDSELKEVDQQPVKKVFRFLSVSDAAEIDTSFVHNKSGDVKLKSLHYLIKNKESNLNKALGSILPFRVRYFLRTKVIKSIDRFNTIDKKYEKLQPEERKKVFEYFEEDVRNLSVLFDKDFIKLWSPK